MSRFLKMLACVAFAFALVFSPPSAAHASSGMHDSNKSMSHGVDHNGSQHGMVSRTDDVEKSERVSGLDDGDHTSSSCCSGICVTVVLNESDLLTRIRVSGDRQLLLHSDAKSNDSSSFLRPPQALI